MCQIHRYYQILLLLISGCVVPCCPINDHGLTMGTGPLQVELSQFKSLEPQLSDDSPLENFVRLTEDPGGTQGGPRGDPGVTGVPEKP